MAVPVSIIAQKRPRRSRFVHVFTIFLTIHDSVPSFTTNLQQVLLLGIQVESKELSRAIGTTFFFPSPLYNQT